MDLRYPQGSSCLEEGRTEVYVGLTGADALKIKDVVAKKDRSPIFLIALPRRPTPDEIFVPGSKPPVLLDAWTGDGCPPGSGRIYRVKRVGDTWTTLDGVPWAS
jgi:hypothetical protein